MPDEIIRQPGIDTARIAFLYPKGGYKMKLIQNHHSLFSIVLLAVVILLLAPSTAGAQDDKGPVASRYGNLATAAEMMKICNIWNVTGCCGWSGTWYRRPNTNLFDTKWKHTNGTPVAFVVELMTWDKTTNLITFYQADNKGTYRAYLANGGTSIVRGTTSFYPAGATWSALAVALDPNQDEKGRVTIPR
jgi:hypothetical protein